jgi:hypothetical protein
MLLDARLRREPAEALVSHGDQAVGRVSCCRSMDTLTRTGRLAFAASMVGFGVLMVIHVSTPGSPALAGPWAAVGPLEGWFVAAALLLIAISLLVFAAQHVIYDELSANIIKPWMPWRMLWVYVAAAGFVATALAILTNRLARLATVLLSVQFLLFVLLIHVPDVIAGANRMRDWTNVFIALSMSSGALIVGRGKLPAAPRVSLIRSNTPSNASS